MQAGNGYQVVGTGNGQRFPLRIAQGAPVADRQRRDQRRERVRRQRRADFFPQDKAQGIGVEPAGRTQPGIILVIHHVPGGPQPVLEQPGLVIEAAGVHVAVRPLQPYRQLPRLTGPHRPAPLVPAQPHLAGIGQYRVAVLLKFVDAEIEADRFPPRLRQRDDHAGRVQRLAFVAGQQLLLQQQVGVQQGPEKPAERPGGITAAAISPTQPDNGRQAESEPGGRQVRQAGTDNNAGEK